jgi:hypothetical protein
VKVIHETARSKISRDTVPLIKKRSARQQKICAYSMADSQSSSLVKAFGNPFPNFLFGVCTTILTTESAKISGERHPR